MEQAPPEPQWPAGVTVRPFRVGEDEARFCEAINVSFAHNWNFTPRTVEDFATRTQQESFDPRLWLLAFEGEALIGVINGQVFLDFGWIPQLAVLPHARKRGIGASLLLASFGECWRRGLRTVSLAVDSENESGAHRLYEKVGMRTVRAHVRVEKQLYTHAIFDAERDAHPTWILSHTRCSASSSTAPFPRPGWTSQ